MSRATPASCGALVLHCTGSLTGPQAHPLDSLSNRQHLFRHVDIKVRVCMCVYACGDCSLRIHVAHHEVAGWVTPRLTTPTSRMRHSPRTCSSRTAMRQTSRPSASATKWPSGSTGALSSSSAALGPTATCAWTVARRPTHAPCPLTGDPPSLPSQCFQRARQQPNVAHARQDACIRHHGGKRPLFRQRPLEGPQHGRHGRHWDRHGRTCLLLRPPPRPHRARSLTPRLPDQAREVVILATGSHKALALYKAIEEGVSHMWTVSALQLHPRAAIGASPPTAAAKGAPRHCAS